MKKYIRFKLQNLFDNPITISTAFALMALSIYTYLSPFIKTLNPEDINFVMNFIQWFGVLYGLLIALVLVNVWAQFDNLERDFDGEADAIVIFAENVTLLQSKKASSEKSKREILSLLAEYVDHVLTNYIVETENYIVRNRGDVLLKLVRAKTLTILSIPDILANEILQSLSEIIKTRKDRISSSRQRLPSALWMLLVVSSVLWLIPFYLLQFVNYYLGIGLIGGVTLVIVSILLIVQDLAEPFSGVWRVNIETWDELRQLISTFLPEEPKQKTRVSA